MLVPRLYLLIFVVSLLTLSVSAQTKSRELTIPGKLKLGATLEVPDRPGRYPGFVFMHGSGPSDRDGTLPIGTMGIKPYKHFCKDLAKQGCVVLRYDKRSYSLTKTADKEFAKTILPTNFIDDCEAAILLLKKQPEVDPQRIYLVAHSQGGTLAPWVQKRTDLAGVVLLAPGLLSLREQVKYQINYQVEVMQEQNYLGVLNKKIAATKKVGEAFESVFRRIDRDEVKRAELIGGATPEFFEESNRYGRESVAAIAAMDCPVLIINGTSDLKCPDRLLKSKESILKKNKQLSIVYRDSLTHELYKKGYQVFDDGVPKLVYDWVVKGQ